MQTALIVLGAINILLLLILLLRPKKDNTELLLNKTEQSAARTRQDIMIQFKQLGDLSLSTMTHISQSNRKELENVRRAVDQKLMYIAQGNEKKLGEINDAVDKKLGDTLSRGISSSFKAVSTQLEQVYKSMGEMRTLTTDIGDLKKILSGVKSRGVWGEVRLALLLEENLAPGQYEKEVQLGQGRERVEFAIKLPGNEQPVYLPIDSKFPMDRYEKVAEGQDAQAEKELTRAVLEEAKKIRAKYVHPPKTTDFAIMFVPSEGLYTYLAQNGTASKMQQVFGVMLAGPANFSALLNSLQVGFKTLAIKNSTVEIISVLADIKKGFELLSANLVSIEKNLFAASNSLQRASGNARNMERKLKDIEEKDNIQYLQSEREELLE